MTLKRRTFLKASAAGGVVTACKSDDGAMQNQAPETPGVFEAFIVSDAHMGSSGDDQPTLEQQKEAVATIHARFPDIALWIDTGDAHHGNLSVKARAKARADWRRIIANQSNGAPLFYIPGNHELARGEQDPEAEACALGSLPMRPYYSLSLQGIRFIAVPQLLNTILVTQETLNWLSAELASARDESVIVLSHNALGDTTYFDKTTDYRRTINSDAVLQLLDQHPQVLAWMHGHNHQYQMVEQAGRLYVSNGRVGGFNPPSHWGDFGQGHLGGIHLRIDANGLTTRAYSATDDRFFDEQGKPHLSASLKTSTRFNPDRVSAIHIGHGRAQRGQQQHIRRHYFGEQLSTTASTTSFSGVLNENPDLNLPVTLTRRGKPVQKWIGSAKKRRSSLPVKKMPAGIRVQAGKHQLWFPLETHRDGYIDRGHYYKAVPGGQYRFAIATNTDTVATSLELFLVQKNGDAISRKLPTRRQWQWDFTIPSSAQDDTEILSFYLQWHAKLPKAVNISAVEVLRLDGSDEGASLILTEGERHHRISASLHTLGHFNPDSWAIDDSSNKLLCWWLQQRGVQWQIRNAVIQHQEDNGRLTLRPDNATDPIILAPLFTLREKFVHQIQGHQGFSVEIKLPAPKRPHGDVFSTSALQLAWHQAGNQFPIATTGVASGKRYQW